MGCAGAHDDYVDRVKAAARPIRVADRDLRPQSERRARLFGEPPIDLYGRDLACGADQLGYNRGVVTGAATKMQDALAGPDDKLVEQQSPRLGWPLLISRASSSAIKAS